MSRKAEGKAKQVDNAEAGPSRANASNPGAHAEAVQQKVRNTMTKAEEAVDEVCAELERFRDEHLETAVNNDEEQMKAMKRYASSLETVNRLIEDFYAKLQQESRNLRKEHAIIMQRRRQNGVNSRG